MQADAQGRKRVTGVRLFPAGRPVPTTAGGTVTLSRSDLEDIVANQRRLIEHGYSLSFLEPDHDDMDRIAAGVKAAMPGATDADVSRYLSMSLSLGKVSPPSVRIDDEGWLWADFVDVHPEFAQQMADGPREWVSITATSTPDSDRFPALRGWHLESVACMGHKHPQIPEARTGSVAATKSVRFAATATRPHGVRPMKIRLSRAMLALSAVATTKADLIKLAGELMPDGAPVPDAPASSAVMVPLAKVVEMLRAAGVAEEQVSLLESLAADETKASSEEEPKKKPEEEEAAKLAAEEEAKKEDMQATARKLQATADKQAREIAELKAANKAAVAERIDLACSAFLADQRANNISLAIARQNAEDLRKELTSVQDRVSLAAGGADPMREIVDRYYRLTSTEKLVERGRVFATAPKSSDAGGGSVDPTDEKAVLALCASSPSWAHMSEEEQKLYAERTRERLLEEASA